MVYLLTSVANHSLFDLLGSVWRRQSGQVVSVRIGSISRHTALVEQTRSEIGHRDDEIHRLPMVSRLIGRQDLAARDAHMFRETLKLVQICLPISQARPRDRGRRPAVIIQPGVLSSVLLCILR